MQLLTVYSVDITKRTRKDTVAKSDTDGINTRKRKQDGFESTVDVTCKKLKVS